MANDLPVVPLTLDLTDRALAKLKEAADWLRNLPYGGEESARRFSETSDRVLTALCADVAERLASGSNVPRPDEEASIAFAQPAYKHLFTTASGGKRKRRQAGGVWIIIYALPDANTLQMLTLRHGAAELLTAWIDEANYRGETEGLLGK